MRLKVMSKLSLDLTFDNELKNHNEFELWFLSLPFPVPLNNRIILIAQPMDKTMLDDNINVLNAVTPHISDGTVLSIPVKLATKQHLDTHHEHAIDASMIMEFVVHVSCVSGFVPLHKLLLPLLCLAVVGYNFLHKPCFLDKVGAMQHERPCGFAKILAVSIGKLPVPALLQSRMVPLILEPSSYDNLSSDVSSPARPFVLS
jgi:hypothetical protein